MGSNSLGALGRPTVRPGWRRVGARCWKSCRGVGVGVGVGVSVSVVVSVDVSVGVSVRVGVIVSVVVIVSVRVSVSEVGEYDCVGECACACAYLLPPSVKCNTTSSSYTC